MDAPANEQVKTHGATVLLFLLLSLLAAGPNWGSAQSAPGFHGAKELDNRCSAAQRAAADKAKPDQPQIPLDCVDSRWAELELAQFRAVRVASYPSSGPARTASHSYQARAPPAG